MTAPTPLTHPCEDCETGDCPCGSACEGCDYTGACTTCRGTGHAPGPARDPRWTRAPKPPVTSPTEPKARCRWGSKPPMPPCVGCTREHRSDSAFYGLPAREVRRRIEATPGIRDRVRCKFCAVPFGSARSRWYLAALERGAVEAPGLGSAEFQRLPDEVRTVV